MTWHVVLYTCVCVVTLDKMPCIEDSCRRIIAYVDPYTGASFCCAFLVHYEFLDVRFVERLGLFRVVDY